MGEPTPLTAEEEAQLRRDLDTTGSHWLTTDWSEVCSRLLATLDAARQPAPSEGLRVTMGEVKQRPSVDIVGDAVVAEYGYDQRSYEAGWSAALARQPAPSEGLPMTPEVRDEFIAASADAHGLAVVNHIKGHAMEWSDCTVSVCQKRYAMANDARQPAPSEGPREVPQGSVPRSTGPIHSVERPAPSKGLREALEEAIGLALGGGYQHLQARWRRIATEYDRSQLSEEPDEYARGYREGMAAVYEMDALGQPAPSEGLPVAPLHNGPCRHPGQRCPYSLDDLGMGQPAPSEEA